MAKKRPTGITSLAILEFVFGIFRIGLGLLPMVGALLAPDLVSRAAKASGLASGVSHAPGLGFTLGLVAEVVIVGLFAIIVAYSLWTGKSWGWLAAMILNIIGIIETIISIPLLGQPIYIHIIGILISLVVIYYLTRPHVRAFFRKESM